MPRRERKTDSGLHVVETVTEAPKEERPKGHVTKCRGTHVTMSGLEITTEVNLAGPKHKLTEEQRKERREDNRKMKSQRQKLRRRRKHGR